MEDAKPAKDNDNGEFIICRYVVRNGKRIYPKNGKFFKFPKRKKSK